MKELKFRAWDKTAQKFVYMALNPGARFSYEVIYENEEEGVHDLGDWEQFAGLRDKKGVEIYEGDIVAYCCPALSTLVERSSVFWSRCSWVVGRIDDIDTQHNITDCNLVVIGNIHENPELLNPAESCSLEEK